MSLAPYGTACAGRPAAALDAVRNFTAAAALQAGFVAPGMHGPQQGPTGVLAGYAAHAAEHFERAKRVCKKVPLPSRQTPRLGYLTLHAECCWLVNVMHRTSRQGLSAATPCLK